jgi:hypothetical protein
MPIKTMKWRARRPGAGSLLRLNRFRFVVAERSVPRHVPGHLLLPQRFDPYRSYWPIGRFQANSTATCTLARRIDDADDNVEPALEVASAQQIIDS